ncbi:MAG TPA: D-alanyl-D-alanine carboxypeptidase [Candidatus Dormibacteraeota bacterium]|nr:D-alanyl-D-alanine carboxypeptidase [Candidatus Dormibacteraeota bacterium]
MRLRVGIVLLLAVTGLAAWSYLRPIPAVAASPALPATDTVPGTAPPLPWPSRGSAAVSVAGLGFIGTSGNEQPIPAESVTKVMTALLVLEDRPLKQGESGPMITLTDTDVGYYLSDVADKESVVPVRSGEQITELQALQGLLIPSANNLAETLARWDVGSVAAFVMKMNARAKALGLAHTTFADTSGANPLTMSTPTDLMTLGFAAMKQEVFAQVVSMTQAQLPVAGTVYNVDAVLGQQGIIGMKTGSGLSTGANFLFAAVLPVDGHPITMFGCVMGQATLAAAFSAAKTLLAAMQVALHVRRVIARNQTVATYTTPWGPQTDLVATVDVDLVEWPAMVLRQSLQAGSIVVDQPLPAGTMEGVEHLVLGDYVLDVPLATAGPLYPPGRLWRLTRLSV